VCMCNDAFLRSVGARKNDIEHILVWKLWELIINTISNSYWSRCNVLLTPSLYVIFYTNTTEREREREIPCYLAFIHCDYSTIHIY
jgi:hypothetical protein